MQRCTNCGAAARPGAKFCTSCGTRLNLDQTPASDWSSPTPTTSTSATEETLVATPAATSELSDASDASDPTAATDTDAAGSIVNEEPEATTSEVPAEPSTESSSSTSWQWDARPSATIEDTPATTEKPTDATPQEAEATTDAIEDAPAGPSSTEHETPSSEHPGSTWTWSSDDRSTSSQGQAQDEGQDAQPAEPAGGATEQPSWANRWPLMGRSASQTGSSAPDSGTAPAEGSPADRFADRLEDEEPTNTEADASSDTEAEAETTTERAERASSGWSWEQQVAGDSDVIAESETIVVSAEEPMTPATTPGIERFETAESTSDSPRQRAQALLDELRALLPQIAAGDAEVGTGAGVAPAEVAERLVVARSEAGDFSSLRRTLETAQQNPRDVDTMLDLMNRSDRLLALLDAYERLGGEVDDAVTRLRNG